jgi:FtsH-binding integral membrane protein
MNKIGYTYLHLTAALVITAVSSENPLSTSLVVSVVGVILQFVLLFLILASKPGPYKYFLFFLFCVLIGQTIAPIVQQAKARGVLREVLASVGGIFLAMTIVGFVDNQNFLGFGGYLLAALIGLIVARIGLIIAKLGDPDSTDFSKANTALNWFATVLFAIFIAYDTQRLKVSKDKNYVNSSLGLFLEIINLFNSQAD